MSFFAIGVDLGGTNLRIAAVDQNGNQLETITTSTEVKRGRDSVIRDMCRDIKTLQQKYESQYHFAGTGIGVPGIIDLETGTVRESPNLPDWQDFPVREEIERCLGARVFLENDANVAALGEQWLGAGKDFNSMCMLTLGTGVGGGIVLNQRIWHGMTGMAGELGHMTVDPNGPPCGCGGRGCLEQYASATAIKRMSLEAISAGSAPELGRAMNANPEFSAKFVFQMSINGDAAAQQIFRTVGWALGIILADVVNAFNLPVYVIGGGVAAAWEAFAPAMLSELELRSFVFRATQSASSRRKTLITRALLGSDAGLIGAAYLPIQAQET
ncbi:MAG: ROK family protein [Acidobacteriaceae bacterium]